MKTCANCGKKILLGGSKEQDLLFCSDTCAKDFRFLGSEFCSKCLNETTDDGPGKMYMLNGIGTGWGWSKKNKCPECGSVVMTKCFCFGVPILPMDSYRVILAGMKVRLGGSSQNFKARRVRINQYSESTVGAGNAAMALPDELNKWNWAAFLWGPIWAIGHGVWIGLLGFVPYVGLAMPFVLGAKGSRWAWEKNQYASFEQFNLKQKKWVRVWFIFAGTLLVATIAAALIPLLVRHRQG